MHEQKVCRAGQQKTSIHLFAIDIFFDGQQQIRCTLHFIDGNAARARLIQKCLRLGDRKAAIERGIERDVGAVGKRFDLPNQSALAGLPCTRQHHDREEPQSFFERWDQQSA